MKAVSIDWVKLCTEEKYNYHQKARKARQAFFKEYKEWVAKNGKPVDCIKQIKEIESREAKSEIQWSGHGM